MSKRIFLLFPRCELFSEFVVAKRIRKQRSKGQHGTLYHVLLHCELISQAARVFLMVISSFMSPGRLYEYDKEVDGIPLGVYLQVAN